MGYPLEILLLDDSMDLPTYGLLVPETPLASGKVYERLYGISGGLASSGFWNGRVSYSALRSREYVLFNPNGVKNQWLPCLTLNASGFLSNVYGLDRRYEYRITIDGTEQIIVANLSSRMRGVLWGNHHTGKSNKHPSGYFFHSGFDEFSDQYLINFIKGAVRFETQLKVEFRAKYTLYSNSYLSFDYLIDGEI
jgi:hypothetical protein